MPFHRRTGAGIRLIQGRPAVGVELRATILLTDGGMPKKPIELREEDARNRLMGLEDFAVGGQAKEVGCHYRKEPLTAIVKRAEDGATRVFLVGLLIYEDLIGRRQLGFCFEAHARTARSSISPLSPADKARYGAFLWRKVPDRAFNFDRPEPE
jgi:hypothetical protein